MFQSFARFILNSAVKDLKYFCLYVYVFIQRVAKIRNASGVTCQNIPTIRQFWLGVNELTNILYINEI